MALRTTTLFRAVLLALMIPSLVCCGETDFASSSGSAAPLTSEYPESQNRGDNPHDADGKRANDPDSLGDFNASGEDPSRQTKTFFVKKPAGENPVEIVIALDVSGSMVDETANIEQNLAKFVRSLDSDFDDESQVHVNVTQGVTIATTIKDRVNLLAPIVGSTNALAALTQIMNDELVPAARKPGTSLHFVVVSDDNAEEVLAKDFEASLNALDPTLVRRTSFHAIIGLPDSVPSDTCSVEKIGSEYLKLADDGSLGGSVLDLCQDDWSAIIESLATNISNQAKKEVFIVKAGIEDLSTLEVKVNGEDLKASHFEYDKETGKLTVLLLLEKGDVVEVSHES